MTTTLIHSLREFQSGPARGVWFEACSYPWPVIYTSVRGFTSTCSCPVYNECDECDEIQRVYLRIVMPFNPDMKGKVWIFYAFASMNKGALLSLEPYEEGQMEEAVLPEGVQFVYGRYDLTRYGRQWVGPVPMGFHDAFLAVNNASLVRPVVNGDCV